MTSLIQNISISKKQILESILKNTNIKFPYIKQKLIEYISDDNNNDLTLLSLINPKGESISSSEINAEIMLAYLDFYILYIMALSSYNSLNILLDASKSKYLYIISLYKDINTILNDKKSSKNLLSSQFIDFINTKDVNVGLSYTNSRTGNNTDILSYKDVLTLPIIKSKIKYPYSIIVQDNDRAIHEIESNSTYDSIEYNILRAQNNKIGIISNIIPSRDSIGYRLNPTISGTIDGFFSDKIYIKIVDIIYNEDLSIKEIYLSGSTNNINWSNSFIAKPNEFTSILVDSDIDIGLKIKLYDNNGLKLNDSWSVFIKSITLPVPEIDLRLRFDILDRVSFISFDELSSYKLSLIENTLKYNNKKYYDFDNINIYHNNDTKYICPINSQISDLSCKFKQENPEIYIDKSSVKYKYNHSILNIKAYINEYKQNGNITFDKISLSNAKKIFIKAKDFIPNSDMQKVFIEYSINVVNNKNTLSIPMVNGSNNIIYEHIIPYKIINGSAYYKTRFPVKENTEIKIKNLFTNSNITLSENNIFIIENNYIEIKIDNYEIQNGYVIEYELDLYESKDSYTEAMSNTKWIIKNGICYLYFRDLNNQISLSIRELDNSNNIIPFSGDIYSNIEMRSFDNSYITPMVFSYMVGSL